MQFIVGLSNCRNLNPDPLPIAGTLLRSNPGGMVYAVGDTGLPEGSRDNAHWVKPWYFWELEGDWLISGSILVRTAKPRPDLQGTDLQKIYEMNDLSLRPGYKPNDHEAIEKNRQRVAADLTLATAQVADHEGRIAKLEDLVSGQGNS